MRPSTVGVLIVALLLGLGAGIVTLARYEPPIPFSTSTGWSPLERLRSRTAELEHDPSQTAAWMRVGEMLARSDSSDAAPQLWLENFISSPLRARPESGPLVRFHTLRAGGDALAISDDRERWAALANDLEIARADADELARAHLDIAQAQSLGASGQYRRALDVINERIASGARRQHASLMHPVARWFSSTAWGLKRDGRVGDAALGWRCAYDLQRAVVALVPEGDPNMRASAGGVRYDLACFAALNGETAASIAALNEAIDNGWSDLQHTLRDPDLDSVRDEQGFALAVERMRTSDRPPRRMGID